MEEVEKLFGRVAPKIGSLGIFVPLDVARRSFFPTNPSAGLVVFNGIGDIQLLLHLHDL